jgi:ADP-heptose:LPS heptosyltransferase
LWHSIFGNLGNFGDRGNESMALNIYDPRERAIVRGADAALSVVAAIARPFRGARRATVPRRILLLRLERIGDLLMTAHAIADVRASAPDAEIDLVVGSWNAGLAQAMPAVTRVETLDAAWLAREGRGLRLAALLRRARRWRERRYDLAINFEPDIRSNLMLAAAGARRTAGFGSGGGRPLLDDALEYDTRTHTSDNARALIARVFGAAARHHAAALLTLPDTAVQDAARRLPHGRPLVGIHASGGRAIKQWDPARFGEVARRLVRERGATVVLTGTRADRPQVDAVKQQMPDGSAIDVSGDVDLLTLAAMLARLDVFVTGDTGPMHLAAAVGTPVVAVFGPSDPARYAPRGSLDRVIRVDLPCSPCNRIRLPPERCAGTTPDCLALVTAAAVYDAAAAALDAIAPRPATAIRNMSA